MTDIEWDRDRKPRAQRVAEIVGTVAVLITTAMFLAYILGGRP